MELEDVRYEVENGLAWITIDRPERMNAFRARTVDELIHCLKRAWASADVGVVCLTGAGDRAFCTGGDQEAESRDGRLRAVGIGPVRGGGASPPDPGGAEAGDRCRERLCDRRRARAACPLRHDD